MAEYDMPLNIRRKTGRAGYFIEKAYEKTRESSEQFRRVSQEELMKVAENMGMTWRQIGIKFLGVQNSRLEQIAEENPSVAMRAFLMLLEWRKREKEEATADHLYSILDQDGVPLDKDAYEFLLENS